VQAAENYVILDLSGCTATNNEISGTAVTPTGNDSNIIKDNQYIKGIVLPSNLASIGIGAFNGCTGLTSVTIPNSVTAIWNGTFTGCTGLTSVTIPNSVTSIGAGAFMGCTGLTSVKFDGASTIIATVISFPDGASLLTAAGATANGTPAQAGTYVWSDGIWTKQQ
jgi:hypothetical protein